MMAECAEKQGAEGRGWGENPSVNEIDGWDGGERPIYQVSDGLTVLGQPSVLGECHSANVSFCKYSSRTELS